MFRLPVLSCICGSVRRNHDGVWGFRTRSTILLMLDAILESTTRRIAPLRGRLAELRAAAGDAPPCLGFAEALLCDGLQVVAEIKRRSPSAGDLAVGLAPTSRAEAYVEGGAAAISVITEPEFFSGSLADLEAVRTSVDVPLLRKDFTIDQVQIWEARATGADAILLIVAALGDTQLSELLGVAAEAEIDALVEVHTVAEARRAEASGARIIGVNNRDLRTFVTDLATAESIGGEISAEVLVAESGVSSPDGASRMWRAGYDAILVGEALVRADDPAGLVNLLRSAR